MIDPNAEREDASGEYVRDDDEDDINHEEDDVPEVRLLLLELSTYRQKEKKIRRRHHVKERGGRVLWQRTLLALLARIPIAVCKTSINLFIGDKPRFVSYSLTLYCTIIRKGA